MRILVLLFLFGLAHCKTRIDPLVSTNKGLIRGLRADDGEYSKFLGIPFALVDESNPFGPANPHPGFEDVFEAYDDTISCIQARANGEISGTIQCLNLHIYVPDKASSQNRLPVLVWIHAGGWVGGSPAGTNPRFLLRHDVIVVSISYRVGIYGFLCLDTPEVPGNQGLKDQVLALRWIKENIAAFGGDSSKITLFGVSAGGMSVNLHMYSDYEKLFDRAIIQSGPALSYWLLVPSDDVMPFKLAEYLGYNATDINDALSYLTATDPYLVTAASYEISFNGGGSRNQSQLKPCVEKKFDGVESFLSEHPMNVKNAPKVKSTPIIIGYTDNELGFRDNDDSKYDNNYIIETFKLGFEDDPALDKALEAIRHFYIGEKEITVDVKQDIANFATDIVFAHSSQRMVGQFIESGAKDVFRYVFAYTSGNSTGALHGGDMNYIFDRGQLMEEEDRVIIDRITTMWANFAKYGNPTPELSDLIPVEWKPATKEEQYSLNINLELTLEKRPEHVRMTFWDLFYKLYGKYQMWYQDDSK